MWVRAVLSWLQKSTSSSGSPVSCMISLVMLSLVMTFPAHRPQVQGARAQRLHRIKNNLSAQFGLSTCYTDRLPGNHFMISRAVHLALALSVLGGPQAQDPCSCSS